MQVVVSHIDWRVLILVLSDYFLDFILGFVSSLILGSVSLYVVVKRYSHPLLSL